MKFRPDKPILSSGGKKLTDEQLNQFLAHQVGYPDVLDMLENSVYDSVADGICTNCLHAQQCEPDARANWCEECQTNTVRSCLDIAGII